MLALLRAEELASRASLIIQPNLRFKFYSHFSFWHYEGTLALASLKTTFLMIASLQLTGSFWKIHYSDPIRFSVVFFFLSVFTSVGFSLIEIRRNDADKKEQRLSESKGHWNFQHLCYTHTNQEVVVPCGKTHKHNQHLHKSSAQKLIMPESGEIKGKVGDYGLQCACVTSASCIIFHMKVHPEDKVVLLKFITTK